MRPKSPKHVLITGGGGGLGAALALEFAARGAQVELCGRNAAKLEAAASACGPSTRFSVCDVTDAEAVRLWLEAADDRSPVDCVVACAGLGGADTLAGPLGEDAAAARRVIQVNVEGVINAVAPLLGRFAARRNGCVVIISSLAGLIALPDSPAYCASKSAVVAYGEALRRLLRRSGVRVSVVCPGFVDTDMVRSLPMRPPFMWSAQRAASVIVAGVVRGCPMIAFPWQLKLGVWASRILPRLIVDRLLDRLKAEDFAQ